MTTTPRRSISAGISNENFLKARIMAVTRYPMATVPIPLTPSEGHDSRRRTFLEGSGRVWVAAGRNPHIVPVLLRHLSTQVSGSDLCGLAPPRPVNRASVDRHPGNERIGRD